MLYMLNTKHEQKGLKRLESLSCFISLKWLKSLVGNLAMTSSSLLSQSPMYDFFSKDT
jgi:hypothetical protein